MDPGSQYNADICRKCQAGEENIRCFRDIPEHNGLCPVLDERVELVPANKPIARVWQHAQRSGTQVVTDDKTVIYCRPESVLALLRLYDFDTESWGYVMGKITVMDDAANGLRPRRKQAK